MPFAAVGVGIRYWPFGSFEFSSASATGFIEARPYVVCNVAADRSLVNLGSTKMFEERLFMIEAPLRSRVP